MSIADIIAKKEELTNEELAVLQTEVERHPYFHAAALSLTSALYKTRSNDYGNTLRRTAISIPDRTALFALIEGEEYTLDAIKKKTQNTISDNINTDHTTALINHFLGTLNEETPRHTTAVDATSDYMSYLMQIEQESHRDDENQPMRGQSLIDDFIVNKIDGEHIALRNHSDENADATPQKNEKENKVDSIDFDDEEMLPDEYFTETMARIYIKQGKFDKAIKIITRLNAKYPKKNRYFADQMRFLEKLKLNQKYEKR